MMLRALCTGLLLPLAVASCGPVPVDRAEQSCLRDADLAERPRGTVALGVGGGSGGTRGFGSVGFEISGDYLRGRDPAQVYADCVMRRSGQAPTRPYVTQPRQGWTG